MKKIIHIDMDCFFAAIEVRDNPKLHNKPVAVGGTNKRGVIATCNYPARQHGVRSALATYKAKQLCPQLIILPCNMEKYKNVSNTIRQIFYNYTDLVEPLSLDEAYLDVTNCSKHQNSATKIAAEIRQVINQQTSLTASAGIAPCKLLAKIASDWQKPNGQFTIAPTMIDSFMLKLAVNKLFGVGPVTAAKLHKLGIHTCYDLQQYPLVTLVQHFGNFGTSLYKLARGIDDRNVESTRTRKSVSVEQTFNEDLQNSPQLHKIISALYERLQARLTKCSNLKIAKQFVKIKFHDFAIKTIEQTSASINNQQFQHLFNKCYQKHHKPVRLIGLGVRFAKESKQLELDM